MSFYLAQVLTGLASAATLFLVAAGLSLIFGVTRIVNFAHGSFYMLGAYLALTLVDRLGPTPLAFWSALLLAALTSACSARSSRSSSCAASTRRPSCSSSSPPSA